MQNKKYQIVFLSILVFTITLVIYIPSLQNKFVTWDDPDYIYDNLHIRSLDIKFIKWAFFNFYAANWHPLTWISHAIDYVVWGLNPLGHHLTSIILHSFNTVLVLLLTISLFREATNIEDNMPLHTNNQLYVVGVITSMLFGLHPLHVESVAWISERKDLLCGLFFLLSIVSYIRYARESKSFDEFSLISLFSNKKYILTLVCFILALLSKPMAITLPLVLLILDYYPLKKLERHGLKMVLFEKIPFLIFCMGSSVLTFLAQQSGGAVTSLTKIPLIPRIMVGGKSLIMYLQMMIWPANLLPFYPYPRINMISFSYVTYLVLALSITIVSIMLYHKKRQRIWLAVWSYYVITLFPVLGLIKIGDQSMADRYTYLPSIGPFLIFAFVLVWIINKLLIITRLYRLQTLTYCICILSLISPFSYITLNQIQIWKNGETLWTSEIRSNPMLAKAYLNRGKYYTEIGHFQKALNDFNQAVLLIPDSSIYYYNRGTCFLKLGYFEKALLDFNQAINFSNMPAFEHYNNRAITYVQLNRLYEALGDYSQAIMLTPESSDAYYNRGNVYAKLRLYNEAIADYTKAINLSPTPNTDYFHNRGIVFQQLGLYEYARKDFVQANYSKTITYP